MDNELDKIYCHFLSVGFIVLRQAIEAQDTEWLKSELELLHEIPSLIGETRMGRHEYFWTQVRTFYVKCVVASGSELQKSGMRTFYEPIWQEMEPLILALRQKEL